MVILALVTFDRQLHWQLSFLTQYFCMFQRVNVYFLEMCKHNLISTCCDCSSFCYLPKCLALFQCCWASGLQCYSVVVSFTGVEHPVYHVKTSQFSCSCYVKVSQVLYDASLFPVLLHDPLFWINQGFSAQKSSLLSHNFSPHSHPSPPPCAPKNPFCFC